MAMDQSSHNKPTNYYKYVFENKLQFDLEIVLKNKIIRAHKTVLCCKNPVFLGKFVSHPELNRIEILDLDPDAVETFIDYLYTGQYYSRNVNEELFKVAYRFMDPNLKYVCREKLGRDFSVENIVGRLFVFMECNEEKLLEKACTFLARNFNDVKRMTEFQLVLRNERASDAVSDVFVKSNVKVLTRKKNPIRSDLMESATKSDLTIRVQKATFLGHQKILTANPVFKKTIPTSRAANNQVPSLSIPDFDPETFEIFLKHIYGHKVENKNISVELMKVAHQYVESKLKNICEDHLVSIICEDNAVELLFLGADVKSEKIQQEASKFITDGYDKINIQDDFEKYQQHPKVVNAIFKVVEPIIKSKTEECKKLMDENKKLREPISNSLKQRQRVLASYSNIFALHVPHEPEIIHASRFYLKRIPFNVYVNLYFCGKEKVLGMYLRCQDDLEMYRHKVCFSLTLLSRNDESFNIIHRQTFVFQRSKRECGRPDFVSYKTLRDVSKGFISEDKFEVKLHAQYLE